LEIIQPMDLEAGYRSFSMLGKHRLTTSIKLFFPLQGGIPVLNSKAYPLLEDTAGAYCDEALPKLSTEYLVIGEAQTPDEKSLPSILCRVNLAGKRKALRIIGERFWVGGLAGISSPLPFNKLPLSWSKSFGGSEFKLNTYGRGIDSEDASILGLDEKIIALPNIEPDGKIITGKGQRPDPVNFCAIPQDSPTRSQFLGTYDENWLKTRFPGFPDDFSMKAFYSASKDQRFDHFLVGGEDYELENLNHDKPLITGNLPRYRVRIFLVKKGIELVDLTSDDLLEVDNHIDTVTFYPNSNMGMLTYRGTIDSSTDDASQYKHLVCAYENLDSPARSKEHYLLSLIGRIHPDLNMQFALSTKDLIPEDVPCGIAQLTQQDEEPLQLLAQNLLQKSQQTIDQAKVDSQQKLQDLLADMQAQGKDVSALKDQIEKSLQSPNEDEWALKYQEIMEKIAPGSLSKDGKIDLLKVDFKAFDDLSKLSKEHATFQIEKVKDDLALQVKLLAEKPGSETSGQALQIALNKLDMQPELPRPQVIGHIDEAGQELVDGYRLGAHSMSVGTPPLQELKAEVMAKFLTRIENNESHAGYDYAGLNFCGMDLQGLDFSNCYLEQCDFSHCNLTNAKFTKSVLARSNFNSSILTSANLTAANIGACDFTKADLSNAQMEGCEYGKSDFSYAKLINTNLSGSINSLEATFHHCDMTGIIFDEPSFVELDFSSAILNGAHLVSATFINCNLAGCSFDQANISGVNFIDSNLARSSFKQAQMDNCRFMQNIKLAESSFVQAKASNCNFRGADITSCDFDYADLRYTDFSEANAQKSSFIGANLSQSQCMQTDFGSADLSNCNLLEANLMKARLTSAKVIKSNCYGVEFLAATVGKTDFTGSILNATKLENWRPAKWQS